MSNFSLVQRAKTVVKTLRDYIYNKFYFTDRDKSRAIQQFHELYYYGHPFGKTWNNTFWMGVKILKCPLDVWVYQEIIYELKPDLIIECGTAYGGSALFFAHLFDQLGHGQVVTIDIEPNESRPKHNRIQYLLGSSVSDEINRQVRELAAGKQKVLLILDSDHSRDHVLKEMTLYHDLVSSGSYMIVEDTNINGHPVLPTFGPGPMEAVEQFMKERHDFVIDPEREKFLLSFNPKGFLQKL